MSEDVVGKLKGLCGDLQARIEASADYKTLKAVERALADIEALSAPVVVSAAEAPVAEHVVEQVSAEAVDEPAAAVEVAEVVSEAASEPQPATEVATVEAEAQSEPEAAATADADAGPASAEAADAEVAVSDAVQQAPAETAAEAPAELAAESEPAPEVKIPEIPAEDRALVAELVAATSEGLASQNGATTP